MTTARRTDNTSTARPAAAPLFPLHKKVLTALAAVSILGAAGCAGAQTSAAEAPAEETGAAAEGSAAAADGAAAGGATYTDGEYSSTGSYQSPAGEEEVGVTLSVEGDVVTAVTVEPMPSNPTTEQYQTQFAGGISDAIVGQPLADISVDRVAGSSLTSGGFNEAVEQIRAEAQA